jgi:hypothetical protein
MRAVLGSAGWDGLSEVTQQRLTANGATLLVELEMPQPEIPDPHVLQAIAQPALVVGAIGSPPMFEDLNRTLVRWLPNARLVHVGGDHRISPAEPEIIEFLQALTMTPAT